MSDKKITYPDAYLEPTQEGLWKLTPSKGPVSLHQSRDEAYDALLEIREKNCEARQSAAGGDEGCLMCSG